MANICSHDLRGAAPSASLPRMAAEGEGWFVVNAREARWYHAPGRSAVCDFEGDTEFEQLGINLSVLGPGEPMAMYHWEADQEDFLVLSGEALLIVEGEERPLRAWDFAHCPAETRHVIVGAGGAVVSMVQVKLAPALWLPAASCAFTEKVWLPWFRPE